MQRYSWQPSGLPLPGQQGGGSSGSSGSSGGSAVGTSSTRGRGATTEPGGPGRISGRMPGLRPGKTDDYYFRTSPIRVGQLWRADSGRVLEPRTVASSRPSPTCAATSPLLSTETRARIPPAGTQQPSPMPPIQPNGIDFWGSAPRATHRPWSGAVKFA